MTVLIDSWAWIEYWKGGIHSEAVGSYIQGEEEAVVSTINLAEVYHWILKFYTKETAEQKRAAIEKRCFIVPVDKAIAVEAAKINHDNNLDLADSLILATARMSGSLVLTGDSDLKSFKETVSIGQ